MFLEWLIEFLTVAKHLNITRAARELNMTQPNLSRHIQQMERLLGFPLLAHNGSKISLTQAGREFADGISVILRRYDELVDHCQTVNQNEHRMLTVQEPLYNDEGSTAYFSLLEAVARQRPTTYAYETIYHASIQQCLLDRRLDIALCYTYGEERAFEERMDRDGLRALQIASIPIAAWVSKENPLSNLSEMTVKKLAEIPILTPNDVHSPMYNALSSLFKACGQTPTMRVVNTASQTEFMRHRDDESAFVFPLACQLDTRLRTRTDLKILPLERGIMFNLMAVSRQEDRLFDIG